MKKLYGKIKSALGSGESGRQQLEGQDGGHADNRAIRRSFDAQRDMDSGRTGKDGRDGASNGDKKTTTLGAIKDILSRKSESDVHDTWHNIIKTINEREKEERRKLADWSASYGNRGDLVSEQWGKIAGLSRKHATETLNANEPIKAASKISSIRAREAAFKDLVAKAEESERKIKQDWNDLSNRLAVQRGDPAPPYATPGEGSGSASHPS